MKSKGNDKIKDISLKLEKYNLQSCNDKIILSTLSSPFKDDYTNYIKVGDEIFDYDKDTETETCNRMMNLLKLTVVPNRRNLIDYIESNKILDTCSESVRELYYLIEKEKNPLIIAKKSNQILNINDFSNYSQLIKKNSILRCLIYMSNLYESISLTRLENIFSTTDRFYLEEIIYENTRTGLINCFIDHGKNIVNFRNHNHIKITLNNKIKNFQNTIESITNDILKSQNKKKLNNIKQIVFNELNTHTENGLTIYDNLVSQMKKKIEQLKEY